jgi:alkylated DNA repair dioxygenase AlkB
MTRDLFAAASGPAGFAYAPDLFSEADEHRFVAQFETLAFAPFAFHGYLGNRRIVSFGWKYDYGARKLEQAQAMPDFLEPLKRIAAGFSGIPASSFAHALITEYRPGAGIGWHRDKPMFEDVVALSFLAPCTLRFRRREGEKWLRHSVSAAPRSGYLLRGDARDVWEHSIPALTLLRYSVTFRNFRTAEGALADTTHRSARG